ncbi:bifunctional folylpolyglutamate synthase/dihydrofolate synthase [Nanoarchaeota archaeon]
MDYKEIIEYLNHIDEKREWNFGLERTNLLLEKIYNPHNKIKFIHVAGSNGKGSVCHMISSILTTKFKVGLYTSPHLVSFNERFQINGKKITDEDIVRIFSIIEPLITDQTYFEIVTCMAFLYFADKKVDYAIIETGLGGRLDATNVITPEISVLTKIGLEHTNILGNSLEEIAKEKCGIIKEGKSVVTVEQDPVVREIIEKIGNERDCKVIISNRKENTNLIGAYQNLNAGLAATSVTILDLGISEKEIKNALLKVNLKGRLDIRGNVIFDVAHNPDGINVLVNYLKDNIDKEIICVFGVLNDKDWKKMLDRLNEKVGSYIFTKPNSNRSLEPSFLAEYNKGKKEYQMEENPIKAFDIARGLDEGKIILVTGSFYVVSEILSKDF